MFDNRVLRETRGPKMGEDYITRSFMICTPQINRWVGKVARMEDRRCICTASRCTYGSTGHVTKAYVSDSNQFKIYIESEVHIFWVYGDFSATLYSSGGKS